MIAPGKDGDTFLNYAHAAGISLLDWLSYKERQKENNNGNNWVKKKGKKLLL